MDNYGLTDIKEHLEGLAGWAEDLEKLLGDIDDKLTGIYTDLEYVIRRIPENMEETQEELEKILEEVREVGSKLEDI